MATIYLVDTSKDTLKIEQVNSMCTAIALARGYLFTKEEKAGDKHDQLKEYWANGVNRLQYRGSKVYCLVTK